MRLFCFREFRIDVSSALDVGRVTYAEMLYRTNLIAYVPADHVTGLPSNVGKNVDNCIEYLSIELTDFVSFS